MVTITHGLTEAQRGDAARLYWEAFGGKLGKVLGPDAKAHAFLSAAIKRDHCFAVSGAGGDLLGIAGFKSPQGAFVGGSFA